MGGTLTGGKKWASGTFSTLTTSTKTFEYSGNTGTFNTTYLEITGLSFKPSVIVAYYSSGYWGPMSLLRGDYVYTAQISASTSSTATKSFKANSNVYVNNTTVHLPCVDVSAVSYVWYAYE